jgi:ankyrin repeat protein
MSSLPERASLEYLKKLAKERLRALRTERPSAKLADAQLAVAREHGFSSWRALKAEIDRRRAPKLAALFDAARQGNVEALRSMLDEDAALVHERTPDGSTPLHLAVRYPDAVRLLLERGADPNARDVGDNATALHFAAANRLIDIVRLLLDAGADVHGTGDLHEGDVIGWAAHVDNRAVVDLLLARGARHHIFSAMAMRDRDLVERLVEEQPASLRRRRSRFENRQTPVHAAFAPPDGLGWLGGEPDYDMLALLIELGADLEATDDKGRTPLAVAMLRGDRRATDLLTAAGATPPTSANDATVDVPAAARSIKQSRPMFGVPDMRATVRWYQSVGFTVVDQYEDGNDLVFARVTFGEGEFALTGPGDGLGPRGVSLWFFTDRIDALYSHFKERQAAARASLADGRNEPGIRFEEDLYTPFYGGRQFSVADLNGLSLIFWHPPWL